MNKLFLFITIAAMLTSCAATYCPNEKSGKQGQRKDKVLRERKVAGN